MIVFEPIFDTGSIFQQFNHVSTLRESFQYNYLPLPERAQPRQGRATRRQASQISTAGAAGWRDRVERAREAQNPRVQGRPQAGAQRFPHRVWVELVPDPQISLELMGRAKLEEFLGDIVGECFVSDLRGRTFTLGLKTKDEVKF